MTSPPATASLDIADTALIGVCGDVSTPKCCPTGISDDNPSLPYPVWIHRTSTNKPEKNDVLGYTIKHWVSDGRTEKGEA